MAVKRKDAPVRDLRSALEFLRGMQGQLAETEVEVDPAAELSGVYRYVGAGGTVKRPTRTNGPAMLFKNLKGHPGASAAIGVLASRERVARLLGCAKEDLGRLLCESVASPIAPVLDESPAPCQEVVHLASEPDFDLFRLLPAPTNTPVDAGPYITLGMCSATPPDTGCSDVTIHRLCIQGRDELSIFLQPGSRHIGAMAERAEELGRPLPISVSIGVDPAIEIGACFEPPTTPPGYDELSIAGAIRGEPVRLCRCVSVAERAIAHSEFVIEGEIVPGVRVQEDQHSGTGFAMPEFPGYNGVASSECWLLKVKALTHRRAPILQMCKKAPTDEGRQRQAALLAFSAFPELKHVVLVDEDVDIFDTDDVLWALNTRYQGDLDTVFIPGVRCHPLDPSAGPEYDARIRDRGISCKTIFDCTVPFEQKARFERAAFLDCDPRHWLPDWEG